MAQHVLKTDAEVFEQSWIGNKHWEIRLNDRDYRVGDRVMLDETQHTGEEMKRGAPLAFTGRAIIGTITYVLHGPQYGLVEGWVIFSLSIEDFWSDKQLTPPVQA